MVCCSNVQRSIPAPPPFVLFPSPTSLSTSLPIASPLPCLVSHSLISTIYAFIQSTTFGKCGSIQIDLPVQPLRCYCCCCCCSCYCYWLYIHPVQYSAVQYRTSHSHITHHRFEMTIRIVEWKNYSFFVAATTTRIIEFVSPQYFLEDCQCCCCSSYEPPVTYYVAGGCCSFYQL